MTKQNTRLSLGRVSSLMMCGMTLALLPLMAHGQTNPLVTGKRITLPPLGVQQNVGSLPMNLITSPNGRFAITSDMGFRQSLWSINTTTGQGVSHFDFPGGYSGSVHNPNGSPQANGLYYGLAITDNGNGASTLYAAMGANKSIAVMLLDNTTGALSRIGTITSTVASDFPAGLALFKQGNATYLAVAMNDPNIFNIPCSLAIFNTSTGLEVGRYKFTNSFFGTPNFPYAVAALSDGSKIFVTSQRDGSVYVINGSDPASPALIANIPTGAHPVALLFNKAQTRLYCANAHSDTVSVINPATNSVTATLLLRPTGATTLPGATPTNLALSPDENRLYATLGDMNAVAVVDLTKNALVGYIPTGWYPTGVAVTARKKVLVSNAKGTQTRYPNPTYSLSQFNSDPAYGLNLIEGNVSTFALPNSTQLTADTQQVLANNYITAATATPANPLAGIGLQAGKIKHVIYIIKENRTYDQVLGDLTDAAGNAVGNGAPNLTIFGKSVTPNLHALALRFVTLDNFYDCAEASGDGWPWSTQSFATEYVIKNLPYNYSGRGRQYDFEGTNNNYLVGGFPAKDPDGGTLSQAFPNGAPPIPDVSEAPANHIWDVAERAGLSYRNYGFFYSFGQARTNAPVIPDSYPAATGLQPAGHDLAGLSDWDFRRYDNDYADSDAPQIYFNQSGNASYLYALKTFGKHNAPSRFSEWNTEFQEMLTNDPTGNTVPNFMTVRFNHDHTQGFASGKHSPRSEVADNDYAVGQLVDTVSKSPIWSSTAIFVIEDDSQDGPDHVDSHRSICFVISPYIKANSVDHTFYNTDSVLKTMEQLLGLPPMSQYDAVANPILDFDTSASNSAVYNAILPDMTIIGERIASNLKPTDPRYKLAQLTAAMDFTHPDSADPLLLNQILWKSVKGVKSEMPAPRHAVALPGKAPVAHTARAAGKGKSVAARRDDD